MANKYSPWSDYRDERLTGYWREGLATRQIARQLNTTKNAVIGRAHRLRLGTHPGYKAGGRPAWQPSWQAPAWWEQMRGAGCTYDLGDDSGFSFCGADVKAGSSMCPEHHTICFIPPKPVDKRLARTA